MNALIVIFFLGVINAASDNFRKEAEELSSSLKKSLMTEVSKKINQSGAVEAVPYCHANVKAIAKSAASSYLDKYTFGRTSHKIRNKGNTPEEWMIPYLEKFKTTKPGEMASAIHVLNDGKRVYLEPLYVQPMCLSCHGESVSPEVKERITKLYPGDQATGFKAGEFRGILWVKEK